MAELYQLDDGLFLFWFRFAVCSLNTPVNKNVELYMVSNMDDTSVLEAARQFVGLCEQGPAFSEEGKEGPAIVLAEMKKLEDTCVYAGPRRPAPR